MAGVIPTSHMPISVYFMLVWTAHVVAALFHLQALLELRRFLAQPSRERRTLSRRERIPFAKAVLSLTAQIALVTILAVTTECLLLSHLSGGATASAVVCPILIGCSIVVVQGLLCRFTSTAMMWDAEAERKAELAALCRPKGMPNKDWYVTVLMGRVSAGVELVIPTPSNPSYRAS